MGTKFSIMGDAVNRHAGNLDGSVADLNANLQQFINALAGLPGVWRGAAFQSFDQLQQRWEQASRDLNLALGEIRGRVGEAGTLYDQYHADQQATIGRAAGAAAWDAARFTG
jgi:WXG100 family type VII secretion target